MSNARTGFKEYQGFGTALAEKESQTCTEQRVRAEGATDDTHAGVGYGWLSARSNAAHRPLITACCTSTEGIEANLQKATYRSSIFSHTLSRVDWSGYR